MASKGEGGGINWEFGINTYMLMCEIDKSTRTHWKA